MAKESPTPVASKSIFLFSHPRTVSNVLNKLISSHPQVKACDYAIMPAFLWGPEKQMLRSSEKIRQIEESDGEKLKRATFQAGLDRIQKTVADANAEGKTPFLKEHCLYMMPSLTISNTLKNGRPVVARPIMVDKQLDLPENSRHQVDQQLLPYNPTLLPDRFFKSLLPIFLIRHPARMIPSLYRALHFQGAEPNDPDFPFQASYKWTRLVFEAFRISPEVENGTKDINVASTSSTAPILIDGDDLIMNAEAMVGRVCELVGLDPDPSLIKYNWEAHAAETNSAFVGKENGGKASLADAAEPFLKSMRNSTGVVRDEKLLGEVDIAEEKRQWVSNWGEDVANGIECLVNDAMDDYRYLHQFRLQV